MPETGKELPDDIKDELKRRLDEGESPSEIAEDDDMPTRRTIYNYRDKWADELERREQMEREVFRDSTTAGREDIIETLEIAGVGIKTDGEPKAKVEQALNAIEMDAAWDDPHYVRDILYDEANMTREWANRIVRKAYDRPDFPYQEEGGRRSGRGGEAGTRSRRPRGSEDRSRRSSGGDRRRSSDRSRGRDESGGADPQIRREMQQLRDTVSDLAETVTEVVQEDQNDAGMVEIERNGATFKVPANSPMAMQMMMDPEDSGDDADFVTKLRQAKDAGVIPSPEDFQQDDSPDMIEMLKTAREAGLIGDDGNDEAIEMMGNMMDEMSEKFAEAQTDVATQMSAAISQLSEDTEEDDDLSLEDVKELIEEERKQDKIDRLEQELDKTREEIKQQLERRDRGPSGPEGDTEFLKHREEMDFKREQLQSLNENVKQLPDQLARGVQEGLLPLFDRLQMQQASPAGEMWSPPEGEAQGQPDFAPDPVEQQSPQAPTPETAQESRGGASAGGYPSPEADPEGAPDEGDPTMGQAQPDSDTAERGEAVREKLGLNDDNGEQNAEA